MEKALLFGVLWIIFVSIWIVITDHRLVSQEREIKFLKDNFSSAVGNNQELLKLSLTFLLEKSLEEEDYEGAERYTKELHKLNNLFKD